MKQLIAAVGLTTLLGTTLAIAHPHETDKTPYKKIVKDELSTVPQITIKRIRKVETDSNIEKDFETDFISKEMERHFKDHSKSLKSKLEKADKQQKRAIKKYSKSFDLDTETLLENPDALREAAKDLESMLAESGLVSNFVDIFADIIEDIDVENDENGMALNFDGKTIGRLQMDGIDQDNFEVEAMGRNMTIEKEVVKENGKTRTRIVIEMDDGEMDSDETDGDEMDSGEDVDIDIKPQSKKSGF